MTLVADINQSGNSDPKEFEVFPQQNLLYFTANDNVNGGELWRFDGANVSLAADVMPGSGSADISNLTAYSNSLYFKANGSNGVGLYTFNGGAVNFVLDVEPDYMTAFESHLFFAGFAPGIGVELWRATYGNNHCDSCGNVAAVCQDVTISLGSNGQVAPNGQLIGANSTADCGITAFQVQPAIFDCNDIGANTATLLSLIHI